MAWSMNKFVYVGVGVNVLDPPCTSPNIPFENIPMLFYISMYMYFKYRWKFIIIEGLTFKKFKFVPW